MRTAILALVTAVAAAAAPPLLTLEQAAATAVKNHPRVSAALLSSLAANQVVLETRSAWYPTVNGNFTSAGALDGSRLAAGSLNNPVIYNRLAAGVSVGQLITDFGRTSNLVASSRLQAQSARQSVEATREQVLLQLHQAYFAALTNQALLRVARQTVNARQLVADQVAELARNRMKSGLDVSFAEVNLSEAKLLLASAENQASAAFADLSVAMGLDHTVQYTLVDPAMPSGLPTEATPLIDLAFSQRPDVAVLRLRYEAGRKFAQAEADLSRPTISALAAAGGLPARDDDHLRGRYLAAGVNVTIPVFNGYLFSARRREAEYAAQSSQSQLRDLQNTVAHDVEVALLNASTAKQRIALTDQLLAQAQQALDLAQSRYDLGLGNIVELSQAQLNVTSAEIRNAGARYDYQLQRSVLDYQTGSLR